MYLALYRKYRPVTFSDVISQPEITKTLTNQIINKQAAHAYLFTGSRGTGKTTCAKILAKAVNCEQPAGGNPCLICNSCKTIEGGVSDIVEIDAASNNSVDDVRLLRDELNYLPVSCKFRVYIIDEAHMLSISAFNALLKTIEEPPPHVIFILATTENHKIPATILSRCQRFDFRRIDIKESADRLVNIAQKEGAALELSAALLISRLSEGGMRDALSLLDTCLSKIYNQEQSAASRSCVTPDLVRECAGIVGSGHLFSLSEAALERNSSKAIEILTQLWQGSKDLTRLIDELIYHYRNLMLLKVLTDTVSGDSLSCLPEEILDYKSLSERMSLEEIMRCMRILESGFERIGRSKNAKITAEMTIIGLCEPGTDLDISSIAARLSIVEQKLSCQPEQVDNYNNFFREITEPPKTAMPTTMSMGKKPTQISLESPVILNRESAETVPTIGTNGHVNHIELSTINDNFREWEKVLDSLPPYLGAMLNDVTATIEENTLYLSGGELAKSVAENPENKTLIIDAAQKYTGGEKLNMVFRKSQENQPHVPDKNKIDIFIDHAKKRGVEIKIR